MSNKSEASDPDAPSTMNQARLLAAQALAQLIHHDVIHPINVRRSLELLGIPAHVLEDAQAIRARAGWAPMAWPKTMPMTNTATKVPNRPKPRPPAMPKAKSRAERVAPDGSRLLRCSSCKKWRHEQQFIVIAASPHLRKSTCHECRTAYQRARHLNNATRRALRDAGIELVAGDEALDVLCVVCGDGFRVGDKVRSGLIHAHWDCTLVD